LVFHCRWLGIPIDYSSPKALEIGGHLGIALASTNQLVDWQNNFDSAFTIKLYFSEDIETTWEHVAALVHEMGHVSDYRENLFIVGPGFLAGEKRANKYARRIIKLLDLPGDKINSHLRKFIQVYKKEFEKGK